MTIRSLPDLFRRFQQIRLPTSPKQTSLWAHCLLSRYQGDDWKEIIGLRTKTQPILLYEDYSSHEEILYAFELYHWPLSNHLLPHPFVHRSHYAVRVLEGEVRVTSQTSQTNRSCSNVVWRAHPHLIHHEATYRAATWVAGDFQPTTMLTFRQTRQSRHI